MEKSALNQQFQLMQTIIDKTKSVAVRIGEVKKQISTIVPTNPYTLKYYCRGLSYYDEESSGDGFQGLFFDNEFFMGKSIEKPLESLELNWGGEKPYEEINPDDFSAIFTGFLVAPLNDEYQFHIYTDAAVSLKLNGETLIDQFMEQPNKKGAW